MRRLEIEAREETAARDCGSSQYKRQNHNTRRASIRGDCSFLIQVTGESAAFQYRTGAIAAFQYRSNRLYRCDIHGTVTVGVVTKLKRGSH